MSVGWRPAEKKRDRQLLQSFTCAPKNAPAYQTEVQRFLRGKAQSFVNSAKKDEDAHLLLLLDDETLAGVAVHTLRPTLPAIGTVVARVVEYIGVSIDYQGPNGKLLGNGSRASVQLLGTTFAHIASRPVQPQLVAAAIHKLNLPSARLFAKFGVDRIDSLNEPYRLQWAAWNQSAWMGQLPDCLP